MGNTSAVHYQRLPAETFEDVELENNRNFDCVLVFDVGSAEKDWKAPADGAKIQYEYLKLLDQPDQEKRKELFPQHGADFASSRTKEKDFYRNERKLVLKALAKLSVKASHISAMNEIEKDKGLKFYYIGIKEKTARKFADRIQYELEIEPQSTITYLSLHDGSLAKATVSDDDKSKHVIEEYWYNMYVKFVYDVAPEIYKPHDVLDEGDEKEGYEDSLFRIRDRLALINEIVCQDVPLGGCGIYVPALAAKDHCIIDFFPLHTLEHLNVILSELFSFKSLTITILSLPLSEIRVYFGEYIAIYFAYLQYMTIYFVPLSIFGVLIAIMQSIEGVLLVTGIEYFSIFTVIWAVAFPILWKRKEFKWAKKWGTLRFDLKERPRPEFSGVYRKSNITGVEEEYFPHSLRNRRRLVTLSVVITFLIALFGSIVAIIILRVYVAETSISYGSYYISIANALVIMFFNNIYGIFAEKLNEWENYKTETEYENNLIIKIFIFRFINSYATLYYIAFFRRYDTDPNVYCSAEDCMTDLAQQLSTIFITQLTVSNAIELGSLVIGKLFSGGGVTSYFTNDEKDTVWNQYSSQVYERTFDDYCEILVSFGYASLFVLSFPLAPLCAFIGCVVEARIDGYKLCKLTRRPFPRQADDVGTWQLAMEVMGWAVLVTNLALICFTSNKLDFSFLDITDTYFEETLTAVMLFAVSFFIVWCLTYCIASKPRSILSHENRQNHIEECIQSVGNSIDRYLDSFDSRKINNWKNWKPQELSSYLKEMIYKNPDEYRIIDNEIRQSRFNGNMFRDADEHMLEKRLGIDDHLQKKFILNSRKVLIDQIKLIQKQDAVFDQTVEESLSTTTTTTIRTVFNFTSDNFIQMAEYFEEDLTGQSKRKLWTKVDKDMSSIIEKNEMETFLYFSIVVFIKAKYNSAKLPKQNDKKFIKNVISPLQKWLLHYKIGAVGLTFDEFDRFFPSWLREYYRDNKNTLRIKSGSLSGYNDDDTIYNAHMQNKIESNTMKKNKLGALLGDISFTKKKKKQKQKQHGSSDIELDGNSINRKKWSSESKQWEKRLGDVSFAIAKTDLNTRKKIWDKFDKNKKNKLDTEKSLSRLIYSLIALYIKTRDRNASPPKFNSLTPLLISICNDIKKILKNNNNNTKYITKNDFVTNIHTYLKKVAQQRGSNI